MGAKHVNPTHMEPTRLKKKLATVIRGHKLLKDKRDESTCQFLDLVRGSKTFREKVEAGIAAANQNFVLARSGVTGEALDAALITPKQEVYLESGTRNVTSVETPVFKYKTRTSDLDDICSHGFAFTSSDLDDAVKNLADFLLDMLRLAECKKSCQLIAAGIEKTRHRVNALEHVIIPEAQQSICYVTMKLDENEHSSQTRLMKVKDMMLGKTHHYSEREVVPVVDEA